MFAVVGTVVASLGSVTAIRNQVHHHMPIIPLNGFAKLYGTVVVALYATFSGDRFSFDWSFSCVAPLIYLAVFGSVLAFGEYLTLLKRIGADRAGYTGVAVPVTALFHSTLVENLHWQMPMVVGVALCVLGNVLMLRGTGQPAPATVEKLCS
jgi:drug/metabolite transporter (DMT)-like permease